MDIYSLPQCPDDLLQQIISDPVDLGGYDRRHLAEAFRAARGTSPDERTKLIHIIKSSREQRPIAQAVIDAPDPEFISAFIEAWGFLAFRVLDGSTSTPCSTVHRIDFTGMDDDEVEAVLQALAKAENSRQVSLIWLIKYCEERQDWDIFPRFAAALKIGHSTPCRSMDELAPWTRGSDKFTAYCAGVFEQMLREDQASLARVVRIQVGRPNLHLSALLIRAGAVSDAEDLTQGLQADPQSTSLPSWHAPLLTCLSHNHGRLSLQGRLAGETTASLMAMREDALLDLLAPIIGSHPSPSTAVQQDAK